MRRGINENIMGVPAVAESIIAANIELSKQI
jgi:hypothetical protein